ncbi:MAG: hypothetical protein LBT08_10280 [Synergistaceae bacterium]|jgi:hypothetical protein|nr:hypothetical protein [Synergistaceae bacterium]
MEYDGGPSGKSNTVVKCFIHGRDAQVRPVYGVVVSVTTPSETRFLAERFSYDPMDPEMQWQDLMPMLDPIEAEGREEALVRYERELHEYLRITHLFQNDQSLLDPKVLERKISYFCVDSLQLNAITFLDIVSRGNEDLYAIMPALRNQTPENTEDAAEGSDSDELADMEDGGVNEVFIACEPLLDPVSGVAAGDLFPGDSVYCRISEDSAFNKMLLNNIPDFDGSVVAEVTGAKINELGTAVVAVSLAEGISGAIKLSGSVRIKLKSRGVRPSSGGKRFTEMFLAGACVLAFLCAMALILYLFS